MARESLVSLDRRVVFRETGTYDSITRNAGSVVDVTSSGGVLSFNGTSSDIIYAPKLGYFETGISIRLKCKFDSDTLSTPFSIGTVGSGDAIVIGNGVQPGIGTDNHLVFATWQSGAWRVVDSGITTVSGRVYDIVAVNDGTDLKLYVDGVLKNTVTGFGGAFPDSGYIVRLGRRSDTANANWFDSSIDLVEIYTGELSGEEISLLSSNSLYSGPVKENLVLDCDYTQGSVLNKIYPDLPVVNTAVELRHGVGLDCDTGRLLNYGSFENYKLGSGDFAVECVISSPAFCFDAYAAVIGVGNYLALTQGAWGLYWGGLSSVYTNTLIYREVSAVDYYSGGSIVLADGWNHIVFSYQSSIKTMYRYLNGVFIGSVVFTNPVDKLENFDLGVGAMYRPPSATRYSRFQFPMFRLYKGKALTQNEVTRNYSDSVRRGLV